MLVCTQQARRRVKKGALARKSAASAWCVRSQAGHAHVGLGGVHTRSAAVSTGRVLCIQALQQSKLKVGPPGACAALGGVFAVGTPAAGAEGEAVALLWEGSSAADPALACRQHEQQQEPGGVPNSSRGAGGVPNRSSESLARIRIVCAWVLGSLTGWRKTTQP